MTQDPAAIGIVGCGNIFPRYLTGLARFSGLRVTGCADIDQARATAAAGAGGIRAYASVAELLADPAIDLVVNITIPAAHAEVTTAALAAGKHVYSEKPLAASLAAGQELLASQAASGRRLGCAPDTFLGSAAQTARRAIDEGIIGEPIGLSAFVTHTRPEEWHPDPGFLFRPGGGPLLDMGPYFITGLVNLMGPVTEIMAMTRIGVTPRIVTAPGGLVDSIDVEVPTHNSASLLFANGAIGTALMSFDVWSQDLPFMEIYGFASRMRLPDPDNFDGDVLVRMHQDSDWRVLEPVFTPSGEAGTQAQWLRGMGVVDQIRSDRAGVPHRASAELAYHVLEVLESIDLSSRERSAIKLASSCDRPAPLTATLIDQVPSAQTS